MFNPINLDPPIDSNFPASMHSFLIESHGVKLNSLIYLAAGAGKHPTVILLPGFPGNERNLDIAQAIRRAGWHVVYFNYRGSWGNEGNYTQQNLVEDTVAVFEFLHAQADEYRIDSQKIALIGHSMGGATALAAAIEEPAIQYIASLAGVNWDAWAMLKENAPTAFEELASLLDEGSAPLTGFDGKAFLTEASQNRERYDLQPNAKKLAKRQILLVGGLRDLIIPLDEHHYPLLEALQAENAAHLTHQILDDDHVFSNYRIALTELILSWLGKINR